MFQKPHAISLHHVVLKLNTGFLGKGRTFLWCSVHTEFKPRLYLGKLKEEKKQYKTTQENWPKTGNRLVDKIFTQVTGDSISSNPSELSRGKAWAGVTYTKNYWDPWQAGEVCSWGKSGTSTVLRNSARKAFHEESFTRTFTFLRKCSISTHPPFPGQKSEVKTFLNSITILFTQPRAGFFCPT